jgi:hypothetical protein
MSTSFDQPGFGINWETYWDLVAQKGDPGVGSFPGSSTDNAIVRYDGTLGTQFQNSSVLISDTAVVTGATQIGVNATPDSTNKLSVNSDAVLFNHNGTTSQVKVNKNAAGNTASHLFQTGFSGRAEFGTIGDDNFTLKTSSDGSAFTTALIAASTDGAVSIPTNLTLTNTGLHLLDTNASHDLIVAPGSDLTADRTLTLTTGDANRTLTLTADSSIGGTAYVSGGTDVVVADGGTGVSSLTPYAVMCGGTASTNPVQSIASVGTSGQVLTSTGAGSLPTFQTPVTGGITWMTPVNSTSGTTVDFTSIPAGTKRLTILFNSVSLSGTDNLLVQIGDSGGFETTSYVSNGFGSSSGGNGFASSTSGYVIFGSDAATVYSGVFYLSRYTSGHTWIGTHTLGRSASSLGINMGGGVKSLSDELDRIRITVTGANTFDAGQLNVFYE